MESSCNSQESQLFVPGQRPLLFPSAFVTSSIDAIMNVARVRDSPKGSWRFTDAASLGIPGGV
jgi:hypothetical protein